MASAARGLRRELEALTAGLAALQRVEDATAAAHEVERLAGFAAELKGLRSLLNDARGACAGWSQQTEWSTHPSRGLTLLGTPVALSTAARKAACAAAIAKHREAIALLGVTPCSVKPYQGFQ